MSGMRGAKLDQRGRLHFVLPMQLLQVAQILIAVSVAASILLQARGTGLSSTFGGESTAYRSRRGLERTLFRLTIVLISVYVLISVVGARNTGT